MTDPLGQPTEKRASYLALAGEFLVPLRKELKGLIALLGEGQDPALMRDLAALDYEVHHLHLEGNRSFNDEARHLHKLETLLSDQDRLGVVLLGLEPGDQGSARSKVRHLKGHLKTIGQLLWRCRLEEEAQDLAGKVGLMKMFAEPPETLAPCEKRLAEIRELLGS